MFANEDIFEGNFNEGKLEGDGWLKLSNGDTYNGKFKNGVK